MTDKETIKYQQNEIDKLKKYCRKVEAKLYLMTKERDNLFTEVVQIKAARQA